MHFKPTFYPNFISMKRMPLVIIWLILATGWLSASGNGDKASVTFAFYSEQVNISFSTDILSARCSKVEEKAILDYYQQLEKTDYRTLLDNLKQQQVHLQLNDWLFFQLLHHSVQEIFQKKTGVEQELAAWFLLAQAGYDTRLTYLHQQVFVYVYSKDEIFEVPIIEEKGRNYINLTSLQSGNKPGTLYMLNFAPRPTGKPFSFNLEKIPHLQPQATTSKISFLFKGTLQELELQYDQTLVDLMKRYPLIGEEQYLQFPMSPLLEASLVPLLKKLIADKTPRQALELLVGFTRSSFAYQEDRQYFGKSKPMIADELFFYPYSDCEDRSALFYALVKKLLDLPMLILAYPNHITVAVALEEQIKGVSIESAGKRYYICDPTGPINSSAIGIFPPEYEKIPFEIVVQNK